MLKDSERAQLAWLNRTVRAQRVLTANERARLQLWQGTGHSRSSWPEWERLVGPRPSDLSKKNMTSAISIGEGRKRA